MSQKCYATGCAVQVRPPNFMCTAHWRLVPAPLRHEVWDLYRRDRGSAAHLEALIAARDAVADLLERSRV